METIAELKKAVVTVSGYSKRNPHGGTIHVSSYNSVRNMKELEEKVAENKRHKSSEALVFDKIKNKKRATEIYEKYKDYPVNLKLMLDTQWKDIKITKWKTNDEGKRVSYQSTVREPNLTRREWNGLFKENTKMIHKVINRFFNFNSELRGDLAAEGVRGIIDAVRHYENKYNPSDPADIYKHFYSFVRGYMQSELNKQTATRFSVPYHKQVLYNKFKAAYHKHGTNWDAIYDEMKIRKKDVYPNIEGDEATDLLPKDGYLSLRKVASGTLDLKTKEFEKKVQQANDRYKSNLTDLESRRSVSNDNDAESNYKAGMEEYGKKLGDLKGKINQVKTKEELKQLTDIGAELKRSRELYSRAFKPVSEVEYNQEKKIFENIRQSELKQAQIDFDKETDKTTLTGAFDLFREFEALMSFRDINLSGSVENNEGEEVNMDELTDTAGGYDRRNELGTLGTLIVPAEFKQHVEKFLADINNVLNEKTATIIKLRLGLHKDNELYAHGLWGKPMNINEIATHLREGFFTREDFGQGTYKEMLAKWNENKPTETKKVKLDDKAYKVAVREFESRLNKAKKEISRTLKSSAGQNLTQRAKDSLRDKTYKKYKAIRAEHYPNRFKIVKKSADRLKQDLKEWKLNKPDEGIARSTVVNRVKKEVDLGIRAMRRAIKPEEVHAMLEAYRKMRYYGLEGDIKKELKKSLIFDHSFGIIYKSMTHEEQEVSFAQRVRNVGAKFINTLNTLFSNETANPLPQ